MPTSEGIMRILGSRGVKGGRTGCLGHSLQHVAVELPLAIAQELPYHLAAQAFPLEEEVGHTDGGVRDEAARDQELDALVRVSVERLEWGGERKPRLFGAAVLTPFTLGNLLPRDH